LLAGQLAVNNHAACPLRVAGNCHHRLQLPCLHQLALAVRLLRCTAAGKTETTGTKD
jgi:hypothetical protein